MKYVSTRGEAAPLSFTQTLLAGLAPDGGLYLPESYPRLDAERIASFSGKSYTDVTEAVISPFIGGEIVPAALRAMIDDAYAGFRHPAVAPLVQLDDNLFTLELFHGPTLAFKDLAMQLLARLVDHALKARGQRATVVGATSGDTGAAAIEAFSGLSQVEVFILYPHQRVSEVQRRQMTTTGAPNVHAIAVEGSFDDAQSAVKALFNNRPLRESLNLCGVNSINWARILAQTVYYFTAAVALGAPHRPVSFVTPTGNFGDIFAGWIAKRMGLPIDRLVIAANSNDILPRALESGAYAVGEVHATQSPSMDIQVSSNFERLLFEAQGRDGAAVRAWMAQLSQSRGFTIDPAPLKAIRADFDAFSVSEPETTAEIARLWRESGYLADPHTAVGLGAARREIATRGAATPLVVLGTAHAAKFPDAIEAATGVRPALPPHLHGLLERAEQFSIIPNDQGAVERFIRDAVAEQSAQAAS
ncbi:threonine synthase [Methylocella silvestris BL2]|uniref:Threonine synthase n=1 Tax=Methylocella silvestris (strain DSM 15510 / CIP 108128 / LMG 27833 / NCIMB 13906 / BL2) TaxID=395965 RepID=B8EPL5_METSB|nr:threonine synthase [Methylocella silvestris]ACK50220.1 threonine synthase [Methylocella silvestris BL2]